MALISPPMSLTRDTDLAQRTVTLFGGAREGETVSFGVLTAVILDPEEGRWKYFIRDAAD